MEKKILTIKKPWGRFIRFTKEQKTTVKLIEIKKGGMLSLQSHEHRDELWVALTGSVTAQIDRKKFLLKKDQPVVVKKRQKHRLSSKKGGLVLEISFGKFSETDITRFDDKYGRAETKK